MTPSSLDQLSPRARPWFAARKTPAGIEAEGTARCRLGHAIPCDGDATPDGIFVHWDWDGSRLTVTNDRYGIYPLFYSDHGGAVRISPSIFHVLDGDFPKALNLPALAVFMRLGHFVGEDTPYEHVHMLPPNSRLTWTEGRATVEHGPRPAPKRQAGTFDQAVEGYRHYFARAIARRAPPEAGFDLALSGGRDSRHILFELLAQGHRPARTVTVRPYPPLDHEDHRTAQRIARELGLEHHGVDHHPSHHAALLKDIELTSMCSGSHAWLLPLATHLKEHGTTCIYDGLAGDVLSGGLQISHDRLQLIREGRTTELARALLPNATRDRFLDACFRKPLTTAIPRALAVERLATELERHLEQPSPLVSAIFWNRTRRGIALLPFSVLAHVDTVYCPYLDHDLFDFLIGLDPEHTLDNRLHDEVIRRSYPELAHLPYAGSAGGQASPRACDHYYRRAARDAIAHLLRHPRAAASRLVRTERFAAMLLRDMASPRARRPWHLHALLHALCVERSMEAKP